MTGESAFQFGLGDVLVREPLRNAFFGCYLYLMKEADIPQISVYILLLESSRSGAGNVAGILRRVFVVQMSLPRNTQNSPLHSCQGKAD